jgi:hypothetical protein
MPLNLASPGIVVREVDLTAGRVDPTSDAIGAIVAPFAQGPVNEPVLVRNEQELLNTFGNPYNTDKHYEHWLVATSYLAYGGPLQVVRSDDDELKNAYVGEAGTAPKIRSYEDYVNLGYDESVINNITFAARNPGSWANGIKVAIIDGKSDQILSGVSTASFSVGYGVTQSMAGRVVAGVGTTSIADGYIQGTVTNIGADFVEVKITNVVSAGGTSTEVDYQPGGLYEFTGSGILGVHTTAVGTAFTTVTYTARQDWFDQQKIQLSNDTTISWNTLSDRPSTSTYAASRGSRFDELHVVVIDDLGNVTGNAGTILEKHLSLSKGTDSEYSVGSPSYWRKYVSENSQYIFGGSSPAGISTISLNSSFEFETDTGWDQPVANIHFSAIGASTLTFAGGLNYGGSTGLTTTGSLTATIGDLSTGYDIFSNVDEYDIDFLLMGSAGYSKEQAQALASKLISVAEVRKDAVAFISPYRESQVTESGSGFTVKDATSITDAVLSFYSSVPSSSYAIFDSGYKYMYDRFSDTFRYVPLNGDIAGLCARNDITNFPWFSPAGTQRGAILNAVKLAYNPNKLQRDRLYSNRINPVILSPGSGIILFGDKTGLAKSSAFDRINVRRLFIFLEQAIAAAAKDVMFEFNDAITRSSFVNAVEPFLRDVQAKRGIQEFRLICDETNNTAAIIDSNEFVADIFIKPSRSINFIGLTFVATRSGVAFSEVIGNV